MTVYEIMAAAFPMITVLVVILGACIGSFLNVVIWRLPRGESLSYPPSHCPKCNGRIRPWENLPVISWLMLRGRCSRCGLPISIRYPVIEAVTALLFLAVWLRVYSQALPPIVLVGYFYLIGALIAVSLIDLEHLIIPNRITYAGVVLALLLGGVFPASRTGPAAVPDMAVTSTMDELLAALIPASLPGAVHIRAVLDVALGAGLGAFFLWLMLEAGKRIWGRVVHRLPAPAVIQVTPDQIKIGDAEPRLWDDLLPRGRDVFQADAEDVRVVIRGTPSEVPAEAPPAAGRLTIGRGQVRLEETAWELAAIERVSFRTQYWTEPREVMGLGDVKLLAMIGAFFGVEAILPVLLVSALSGCLVGGLLQLLRPAWRGRPIPYGPFLAVGAVTWFLAGPELLFFYQRLILSESCG
jgi:leader peptidase (prepilin peptidase)/N-methyltransferase